MPVPEPMAPEKEAQYSQAHTDTHSDLYNSPRKSASTDRAPIHSPPKAAAVGMYLLSS